MQLTFTPEKEIKRVFELQKKHYREEANKSIAHRKKKLIRLEKSIYKHREAIKEALYKDHKKTSFECDMLDMLPVLREIRNAKKNIYKWCADKNVSTPLMLLGSRSYVRYESKGVVLIMAPWNFPVNLTFVPMISAIAAGNTVMYHTSEQVPHVCAVIQKIVQECFDESEVFSVMGGLEEAKILLTLPFHHIFFTGSPRVGKIVMESAVKNLTSVTLELGGKSPTIVDKSANLRETAKRMLLVKFQVNGQVCITPDYVFVHKDVVRAFATELKKVTDLFLGEDLLNSENYSRIVNKRQYERMKELLKDVEDSGGEILQGGNTIDDENFVEPTFFIANRTDSRIMQEEIFGPILPLIPFERDEEIVEFINRNERPLASYIYSKNKKQIDYIVKNTRSGATVVNASGIHHYNENLPFGGINNSGIGKSHGFWGFQEFSNPRAMMKNNFLFHNINLLMPPHGRLKKWILEFTIKYL